VHNIYYTVVLIILYHTCLVVIDVRRSKRCMEGRVSATAGTRSICVGLLAVSHASGSSDWLDGWSQDAGLRPPAHVNDDIVDADGSALHALPHRHWTPADCWLDGGQYHLLHLKIRSILCGYIMVGYSNM